MVSTLAFHAGDRGSIPPMDQQIFNFPFSPSDPSGVTKPSSSLKLATSKITYPSGSMLRGESHKSYKGASIKAYLLLQGLSCSGVTGVASALLIWLEWIIGLIHCEWEFLALHDLLIHLLFLLLSCLA